MRVRPRIDRVLPGKTPRPGRDDALNLADLDPPVWHIMSRDTSHGPFTLGQLQAFADAGKIGPLTRISSGNGEPFLPALDHAPLRSRIEAMLETRRARREEASNFVIVTGQASGLELPVTTALGMLGRFAEPVPGTFVLRSKRTLGEVRQVMAAATPAGAQWLIFESRDARLGWSGLPPERAGALSAVWDAPVNPPAD